MIQTISDLKTLCLDSGDDESRDRMRSGCGVDFGFIVQLIRGARALGLGLELARVRVRVRVRPENTSNS